MNARNRVMVYDDADISVGGYNERRKMKNRFCVVAGLLSLFWVVGCGGREVPSVNDVISEMEADGFIIKNSIEQFADYEYVEQAYIAIAPDETYQVEFYDLDSEENAASFYAANYNILSESEDNSQNHVSVTMGNYQNYEITTKTGFGCITRVGDTCFYAVVGNDYSDDVRMIKDELGY